MTPDTAPVFVSSPEPAWLTPDIKHRFINFNGSVSHARAAALRTQEWRTQHAIDTVLCRPCPCFEPLFQAFPLSPLVDDNKDGNVVVLVKAGCISGLCSRVFHQPEGVEKVTLEDVEHALALLNEYFVTVSAPKALPAGKQVQIFDLDGFRLSDMTWGLITLFKLLVRFVSYYPDRLQAALVINAPPWFAYPWKVLSAFLDEQTNARVVVASSPKEALTALARHMGGLENVPASWGGSNPAPCSDYPAYRRLLQFVKSLNEGGQPVVEMRQDKKEQEHQGAPLLAATTLN